MRAFTEAVIVFCPTKESNRNKREIFLKSATVSEREKRIIFSSATLYRNKVDNFQEYVAEEEQFYDGYREYRSLLLSFLHFLTSLVAHFQSMTVTDSVSIAPL